MNKITTANARLFNIGAIIIITLLAIARIPSLHIPYFWDELGVYAPGALRMKDDGHIGILPADLDPLYSRGHPLLFYFFAAGFYKIFGDTVAVGHTFAILSACTTLFIFFIMIRKIFNARYAFYAVLLLSIQPVFFAMAGVLFPEMLLTLFILLTLWGIIENKWWLYAIAGSFAILVKEPAIIIPPVALCILFIDSLRKKDFFSIKRWKLFLIGFIPLAVYGVFLLIQKKQNGWYFFPYHIGYISFHWTSFYYGFKRMLGEIFLEQGRWILTIPLLLSFIGFKSIWGKDEKSKRILMVTSIFVLLALLFSCFNFYLSRYLLFVYPPMILVFTYAIMNLSEFIKHKSLKNISIIAYSCATVLVTVAQMDTGKFKDTYDMSYVHTVACVQKCISWVEEQPWKSERILTNFPIFQALEDKRNGYLSGHTIPYTVDGNISTSHVAYFYLDGEQLPDYLSKFVKIRTFDDKHSHIIVMKNPAYVSSQNQ